MTVHAGARRPVTVVLREHGWVAAPGGTAGDLWRPPPGTPGRPIAVLYDLQPGTPEYDGVLVRMAAAFRVPRAAVAAEVCRAAGAGGPPHSCGA